MAKNQIRTHALKDGSKAFVQQHESIDDTPLPDADYIQKLMVHDPSILEWLKERSSKEQDHRHEWQNKHLATVDAVNKRHHATARLGMVLILVVFGFMAFCACWLIQLGYPTEGTFIGGGTILVALAGMVSRIYGKKHPAENEELN